MNHEFEPRWVGYIKEPNYFSNAYLVQMSKLGGFDDSKQSGSVIIPNQVGIKHNNKIFAFL